MNSSSVAPDAEAGFLLAPASETAPIFMGAQRQTRKVASHPKFKARVRGSCSLSMTGGKRAIIPWFCFSGSPCHPGRGHSRTFRALGLFGDRAGYPGPDFVFSV